MTRTNPFPQSTELAFAGEILSLLPERAVWWPARQTLFVADLHFGKEATFRATAIPIPDQTIQNLNRLSTALHQTEARRLVILGDLIHARRGRCEQTFASITHWRSEYPDLQIDLVRGNHDQSSGDPPAVWRMNCVAEPCPLPPFVLRHHPEQAAGTAVLAGHLHPTVRLSGPGGDSARLACFLLRENVLTLPAFSSFVDGAAIRVMAGDQVFGLCEDRVVKLL